jgi:hypothetical protein
VTVRAVAVAADGLDQAVLVTLHSLTLRAPYPLNRDRNSLQPALPHGRPSAVYFRLPVPPTWGDVGLLQLLSPVQDHFPKHNATKPVVSVCRPHLNPPWQAGGSTRNAMPQVRRLAANISPRRSGFAPRKVHVGFVVDEVALGQFLCQPLGRPRSVSLHRCSYSLVYHLGDGQRGR